MSFEMFDALCDNMIEELYNEYIEEGDILAGKTVSGSATVASTQADCGTAKTGACYSASNSVHSDLERRCGSYGLKYRMSTDCTCTYYITYAHTSRLLGDRPERCEALCTLRGSSECKDAPSTPTPTTPSTPTTR